jgi:2-polyprenyl-3-methyl-5-hydroxy-6-metoxy-1,4-benzoquinol methylase
LINVCEVCGDIVVGPVIDLGSHPLNDDMHRIGTNYVARKYRQEIQLCTNCFTAHQLHPVEKETLFFPEYRYRGSVTKDVLSGMEDLIENALHFYGSRKPLKVLDIGANDGSLLGIFKNKTGCETIGVDPTNAVLESAGRIDHAYCEFFSSETSNKIIENHGHPDIITFTNVFAHIEDLSSLIEAVSLLLDEDNLLVIENHYLGSVLEKNQFDTFYAEHIRTYSAASFEFIAKRLNVEIKSIQFPRRYGGNIRVYMSRNPKYLSEKQNVNESDFPDRFTRIQNTYDHWLENSLEQINQILKNGPLVGKSCPARSVMLYSSLDMNSEKMSAVYEHPRSPKLGFCVPGTSIPIVSDAKLGQEEIQDMILWSWHIAYEIMPYLKDSGYKGRVWAPLPTFHLIDTI